MKRKQIGDTFYSTNMIALVHRYKVFKWNTITDWVNEEINIAAKKSGMSPQTDVHVKFCRPLKTILRAYHG